MEQRVAQATFVHQNRAETDPLSLDGAGKTGRTGAYHQHVKVFL
jgi:hypothetical protein